MTSHPCARAFTGIQAAPEMCAENPLACPFEFTLGLAADLVVLPYDLAKPIFHEECRWDPEAKDGIGMSRSSFQEAVNDIARKEQLDKASTDMLEKKVKFLAGNLGFGYRGETYVEEILQALHREAVPKENLKARAIDMASELHYVRTSLNEVSAIFRKNDSIKGAIRDVLSDYDAGRFEDGAGRLDALKIALPEMLSGDNADRSEDKASRLDALFREEPPRAGKDAHSFDWGVIIYSLGLLDSALGWQQQNQTRLDQAIVSFRAAQTVFTREQYPKSWAHIESKIGNALWKSGTEGKRTDKLKGAVKAYEVALKVVKLDQGPESWSRYKSSDGLNWFVGLREDWAYEWLPIELGLALAYLAIHEETDSADAYDIGTQHYRSALQGLKERKIKIYWLFGSNIRYSGYLPVFDLYRYEKE
ncbi:MAG: hypothetical protein AAGA21_14635 [Pseudomonadota bacterium]